MKLLDSFKRAQGRWLSKQDGEKSRAIGLEQTGE